MNLRPLAAALTLCVASAYAHEYSAGALRIVHPHARPTAPSQSIGGGYLKLLTTGPGADRLVSASTPVAQSVQLHTMRMEGDVMRMREVESIEIPPGQTVELKSGGMHLMLIGLKAPLVAGQRFSLKLGFEKAGEVTVDVTVDAPQSGAPGHDKAH
jgi:copper(I)-binding protein